MALPLNEVNKKQYPASKPGRLMDNYVRVQDINSAVKECKEELKYDFGNVFIQRIIFDKIDKWLAIGGKK